MLKLSSAFVIFSALFCLSHCQPDYIDVTSHVKSFAAKFEDQPEFVSINNQIYTVTIKNVRSDSGYTQQLTFTSIDNGSSQQPKEISGVLSLPIPASTEIFSDKVVVLGNGKLVIATRKQSTPDKDWILLITIDPFDYSTQTAVKVEYNSKYMDVMALVPYYDSYDVFYKYYVYDNSANLPKNPHRYNDQGEHIELDYSLETYPNIYTNFEISTIKPFDASEGYYLTYFDHGNKDTTVLKRLNSRYETVKEVKLTGNSIHISTTQGHINYCLFANEKPVCNFLNADLEVQTTSVLPGFNHPKGKRIEAILVVNTPNQELVVFAAFENPKDAKLVDFYVQPVGSDGSEVKTLKVGTGPLVSFQGHHTYYSLQSYRAYVPYEHNFCFVVYTKNFYKNIDVHNRCLDLSSINV